MTVPAGMLYPLKTVSRDAACGIAIGLTLPMRSISSTAALQYGRLGLSSVQGMRSWPTTADNSWYILSWHSGLWSKYSSPQRIYVAVGAVPPMKNSKTFSKTRFSERNIYNKKKIEGHFTSLYKSFLKHCQQGGDDWTFQISSEETREKRRYLTQPYDKSPYTNRKIKRYDDPVVVRQKCRSGKESSAQPSQNSNEVNNDTWNIPTRGTLLQRSALLLGIRLSVDNKRKRKRSYSVLWRKPNTLILVISNCKSESFSHLTWACFQTDGA